MPRISWRKFSRMAEKSRNSWTFSPSKVSRYTVSFTVVPWKFNSQLLGNISELSCTCRFRLPSGTPDQTILFNFLGSDFESFFTSVDTPRDDPRLAVGRLTVEGSGGRQLYNNCVYNYSPNEGIMCYISASGVLRHMHYAALHLSVIIIFVCSVGTLLVKTEVNLISWSLGITLVSRGWILYKYFNFSFLLLDMILI